MAVDYGGTVADGSALTYAGVPSGIWLSWDKQKQDLFLQDYFRTEEQQNYFSWDVIGGAPILAMVYTSLIDHYTGLDSAEVGETTNKTIDQIATEAREATEISKELLLLGAVAFILTR